MSASHRAFQPSTTDDELPGYRPLSNMAVAGFLFGLASILILSDLKFAFIPILGLAFSALALRRIAALANAVAGRRLALAGLTLSLLFGLAAPTRVAMLRWQMRSESRRFAQQWFDALKRRQPDLAYQMEMAGAFRSTPEATGERSLNPMARQMFVKFLDRPVVQALLTLGERANVRYYQQLSLVDTAGQYGIKDVYAVTVDDGGERTTFFIDLGMERTENLADLTWGWHIRSSEFRTKPPPALPTAP
ncbi:MAG TPA: DUF4190 domain-containing protein [Pirellulales bacterium]|nr:DUF4190 domain-containing protein [Pirellulales bacterium]